MAPRLAGSGQRRQRKEPALFAILAAIAFAIAFLENGAALSVHSGWLGPAGMLYIGLSCLAVHLVRKHGPGNLRSG